MNTRSLTNETLLYVLIAVLALAVRLVGLGGQPLDHHEAALALQAHALAGGENPAATGAFVTEPAYVLGTTVVFWFLHSGDWQARLLPALLGALVVLAAYLLRSQVGTKAALLLALGLAFDPALVGAARSAGGVAIAASAAALWAASWINGAAAVSGVALGALLLSGPGGWAATAALLITGWVIPLGRKPIEKKPFLVALGLTLGLGGTGFLFIPNGISAVGAALAQSLNLAEASIGAGLFGAAFLLYQFFPLLLAAARSVTAVRERNPVDLALLAWLCAGLAMLLLLPVKSGLALALLSFPLWGLAARQLVEWARWPGEDRLPLLGQTGLTLALLTFLWINLVAYANTAANSVEATIRLASIGGAALLIFLTVLLVGWGWSRDVAVQGARMALVVFFGAFSLFSCFHAAGLSRNPENELMRGGETAGDLRLLAATVADVSRSVKGEPNVLPVTLAGIDNAALRWNLRDARELKFQPALASDVQPDLVITTEMEEPTLAAGYRGQDFAYARAPMWDLMTGQEWLKWFAFRDAPTQEQKVIVWVRSDLFPGGEAANDSVNSETTPAGQAE